MEKARRTAGWMLATGMFVVSLPALAEIAVIGNSAIATDSLTAKQISNLWLGKSKLIPGGGKPAVVDQKPGSPAHTEFYKKIVKKNSSQLKAYWAKVVFSGKGAPPKAMANDAEVIDWVTSTPGGLGYVDSASVKGNVKVLFKQP